MSGVRVLVGTRKGAFTLTSDGKRKDWKVDGPHFAGWELYHVKGSPVDPNRLYASQSSGWFGQQIQRSSDGGKTWEQAGNKFEYEGEVGTHQWYDGSLRPWEFKRVWHLEPSLTDPETVYAGVEDASLFRSTDAGQRGRSSQDLDNTVPDRHGSPAQAGCACTQSFSIRASRIASSLPFRRRALFEATTPGRPGSPSIAACVLSTSPIRSPRLGIVFIALRCTPRVRTCFSCRSTGMLCAVTTVVIHGRRSAVISRRTLVFRLACTRTNPTRSTSSRSRATQNTIPPDGKLRVYRSRTGGDEWEALTNGLPQSDCYVNVLRDAMALDTLDPCGVYFGTTGGQVYASSDSGDNWTPIVRDLPAVLSVEVQALP